MLRLNASVHSWLNRQEVRNTEITVTHKQLDTVVTALANNSISNGNDAIDSKSIESSPKKEIATQSNGVDANGIIVDDEFHRQLKDEVGNLYKVWDEADCRFVIYFTLLAFRFLESSCFHPTSPGFFSGTLTFDLNSATSRPLCKHLFIVMNRTHS